MVVMGKTYQVHVFSNYSKILQYTFILRMDTALATLRLLKKKRIYRR